MSRKEGQKRKLLVLLEILAGKPTRSTLECSQLVEKLQEHGVVAERKSVYDDLNTLNNLPTPI